MFAKKLKALKEDIIQWNRSEFGYVRRNKTQLLEALKFLDAKEGEFGLSDAETWKSCGEIWSRESSLIGRNLIETEVEDVMY